MFRHVVTNPTASCHLIRGLVTYDTWPRDLWYEPTYQKVRASHHNHHYIINISGTGVCYDEINRRLPNAGARACRGCGDMEKLGEWVNLMAKHNSRMAKHEPNVAKNDTRKAKHKPRIMTPNVRIIKTRTVRGSSSRFLGFVLLLQKITKLLY